MIYLVYAFSFLNLYFGVWFFLNVIGIIQTSKYSHVANICFAMILVVTSLLAVYFSAIAGRSSLALCIDGAPWIITSLLIIGSLVSGNTK